ncbi:hypothetical protein URH17368_0218 [Alicyclobacillus hesperidum URH17-3-68]|uniref:Small, acid-soluble spore protein, alpha/beta type n=1 Tax=Alicyclobacillus hesperidum TaxID=89784 RepID=A0A1H2UCK1_9BACL|nr:small, acid-soluble spore protein, alpha/beta type [Alicyclobacillus hesperidum]EJY57033.1 hypothetical protein URH17368_0218 [Alicyclobacillus hesperidum URH17-3-68]SDW53174.1 Small, acid-soluble spore protein, alpha/beta type [Alicyclobacillus hesperidum]
MEPNRNDGPAVRTIGKDGQLHVVPYTVPEKPSAAKLVADKLHVPYQEGGDNGALTAEQAGAVGGHLGGPMVAKLVALARQELANGHVERLLQTQKATPPSR